MRIAVGNSRMDKKWKNKEMTWEELKEKCSQTIRTTETVSEYRKMSKPAQDAAKDVGGFVGGALKQGKRKNGFVEGRSLLTLDMDHATQGIWDEITMFFDFKCLMYSTHKHTPEAPRVRLIIPMTREITAEEYAPVSRMVAKDVGMEMVDDTCHEAARLMYWPSTSSDGEFLYEVQDGPMLNPDTILARYTDWHDTSQWPMSSRQSEIVKRTIAKQADPLEKDGIVGAFCRTYSIEAAIDSFLSDIYKPSVMEGRYDFIPADSSAGIVTYDDKFCYSHHATDPACGLLLNAFDVVRVHCFGHLDEKAKLDTAPTKLPSYKAMVDFAINEDAVKLQLAKERELQAVDKYPIFRFHIKEWTWDWRLAKTTIIVGFPMALQLMVISIGLTFIQRAVNEFGQIMTASFTVGQRIEMYMHMPCTAFQTTLATYTGQNIGAGKIDRVRKGVHQGILMSLVSTLCISAFVWIFARPIINLFGLSDQAALYCHAHLRAIAVTDIILSLYVPIFGVFQGTGHGGAATIVATAALGVRVCSTYLLRYSSMFGYSILWWNGLFGFGTAFLMTWAFYLSNRWKKVHLS